jgi:hypothetical protein
VSGCRRILRGKTGGRAFRDRRLMPASTHQSRLPEKLIPGFPIAKIASRCREWR